MDIVGEGEGTRTYEMRTRQDAIDRNRGRIIDAVVELWLERHYDEVSLSEVADRAGVSRQTVHRQFGTKDELVLAAIEAHGPRIDSEFRVEPGDVDGAVDRLVETYEEMGDATVRTLELEGRIEAMDRVLERGRASHRAWIEETFGPFLPSDGERREHAVLVLYAATDVMQWKLLRRDFGRSRDTTRAVIGSLVDGALRCIQDQDGEETT